jgi:hypothetical protein
MVKLQNDMLEVGGWVGEVSEHRHRDQEGALAATTASTPIRGSKTSKEGTTANANEFCHLFYLGNLPDYSMPMESANPHFFL